MELFGFAGVLALALASLAVGVRLLALARRTKGTPELTIGLSYLFAGFLSCLLTLAATELARTGSPSVAPVQAANDVAQHAGNVCLVLFVWLVFRPGTALGRALGLGATAAIVASLAGNLATLGAGVAPTAFDASSIVLRIAIYAWAAAESFGEYAAARRRVRLGLADPLVANRLLLWGVGTGCVLLLWLEALWRLASGGGGASASYPTIAVLGLTCALTSWLAFFPPAAWRRRFAAPPSAR